jgi:peroxin-19
MDDHELDDILENALNSFEEEEAREKEQNKQQHAAVTAPKQTRAEILNNLRSNTSPTINSQNFAKDVPELNTDTILAEALASLRRGEGGTNEVQEDIDLDEIYKEIDDKEQALMQDFANNMASFLKELENKETQQGAQQTQGEQKSFQDTIKETLEALKKSTDGLKDVGNSNDNINFSDFAKMFSEGGPNESDEEGMYGILEKIMETLMSPEILRQPMEELRREYPTWLEENKGKVDADEYERIQKQYEYAEKICKVYESSSFPDCLPQLIDLMKDMQTYGSPPEEIVKKMTKGEDKKGGIQDMCPMQ